MSDNKKATKVTRKEKQDDFLVKLARDIQALEGDRFVEADGTVSIGGLNQKTFTAYRKAKNLPEKDVAEASFDDFLNILQEEFIDRHGIKNIPRDVLPIVVDFSFNSGPANAAKVFQRTVGAKEDGIIGPNTMKAYKEFIKTKGREGFVNELSDRRLDFLNQAALTRPDIAENLNGLTNRVNKVRESALAPQR